MTNNQVIAETQKIRDRRMREICRIKFVKNIQDLENHEPAGLLHITILNNILGKNIKIWNSDASLNRTIGKEKVDDTIEVEYHPTNSEDIGHWTLWRYGKDPDNISIDLNSCLFSVIGSQIDKQNQNKISRSYVCYCVTMKDRSIMQKQMFLYRRFFLQMLFSDFGVGGYCCSNI